MIIYNVTIKVSHAIAEQWLAWLRDEHIPDMIHTGCFTGATILHLVEADDEEGMTYAVQYQAPDMQTYKRYIENFSNELRKKGQDKWGDQFIAFRTLMRVV